jgi:hypothetical protein
MLKHSKGIENDYLITHHWFLFEKLSFVLQPFYETTIYSQSHMYILYRWFTTINWLLNHIFDAQINFKEF